MTSTASSPVALMILLSVMLLAGATGTTTMMTMMSASAQYGGTGGSLGTATPEQLQECEQPGKPRENCNYVTILAKRRLLAPQEAEEVLQSEVQATLNSTQSLCIQEGVRDCMTVDYQSPTFVVLSAEFLLSSGPTWYENPYIWEAVDKLQVDYGFRIYSVTASGLGSRENPTVLHIVLSRR